MIDRTSAKAKVIEWMKSQAPIDDELVIDEGHTIEREYGWIFFYDSKRFLATNAFRFMLAGNGPVVVKKTDGSIHELGTALPFEEALAQFEEKEGKAV